MVKLQRRHFEYLADILLGLKPTMSDEDHGKLVRYFSNMLGVTNANFKDDRFYNRARGIKVAPAGRGRKMSPYYIKAHTPHGDALAALEEEVKTNYWE